MIRYSAQLCRPISLVSNLCKYTTNQAVRTWKKTNKMSGGDSILKSRPDPIITKLDTPQFQAIFTPELRHIEATFNKYKYEIRLAGGPVRDLLQGKIPDDIDLATTATPTEMKQMFEQEEIPMINTNGEKHGTITARVFSKANFEITTLRVDEETDGRHAKVKFTQDWQLDANRRDLTINSMFLDFNGNVYDYFYGYEDLKQKRVAFVGNPSDRIQEDYLRMLRYYRFYGRIADSPDNHQTFTIDAIRENVKGLANISGERIWMEMKKTLTGRFGPELMLNLLKQGAAQYIGLPAESSLEEFQRVTSTGLNPHPITMLVALLNTPEDAIKLHERLRLSAMERDLAFFIAQNREAMRSETDILAFQKVCVLHPATPDQVKVYVSELLKYLDKKDIMNEFNNWNRPVMPISGKYLLDHNCPGGLVMGKVRQALLCKWIDSRFQLGQDELGALIPGVLESLKDFIEETANKKSSGKRKHTVKNQ